MCDISYAPIAAVFVVPAPCGRLSSENAPQGGKTTFLLCIRLAPVREIQQIVDQARQAALRAFVGQN